MKLIVKERTSTEPVEGDIIEFERSRGGSDFYLLVKSIEGWFILNLNGKKRGYVKYYNTVNELIRNQTNVVKMYTKDEYNLALEKVIKQ